MPRASSVCLTLVHDFDLGHVTIDISTPFKWLVRNFPDDSLRVNITADTIAGLLDSIAANLELCPRAKRLVEALDDDSRVSWVEFYEGGLEIFVPAEQVCSVEELCDELWKSICEITIESKFVKPLVRVDCLGLFPRSLKTSGSSEPI